VIVDDGSSDDTPLIITRYAQRHPWITLLPLRRNGPRQPGSGVIRAFNAGRQLLDSAEYEFIVKLDCDLEFPPHYFADLLQCFRDDPRLGIASGVYVEQQRRGWVEVIMPDYHAAGCSKVVRRQCFEDIGGFVPLPGWDTVDEIRAQTRGWHTRHFRTLRIAHLKPEGSGVGMARTNVMLGAIYHGTGGGLAFFGAKVLRQTLVGRPFVLGGLAMLAGYLRAHLARSRRLVTVAEAEHYRRLLNQRLTRGLRMRLGLQSSRHRSNC
jgi:glycosyltransferase involved in cell wall biosynthesis